NQAFNALLFLYREALKIQLDDSIDAVRAKKPKRLPDSLKAPLQEHLKRVKMMHEDDLADGYGSVYLPYALERKYPNTDRENLN
ncbi:MAG: hypothetical protein ACE5PV_17340, partial [Candidatus Poribacteria bacterium]